ncbi:heme A synthase [Streptomyces hoynatensis]|uniref:Heme A synthase n=1 Tax=Streptomyces hoynatensis TaxID=1141874 RepID=A0A3A9Z5D8_9ACTN|nr:heme A synthase [Streptomyces hoynatensis]
MRNPLAFIAGHWTPAPRTVRRAAAAALVIAVVIIVTGGAVRLTGSGLGCETWPRCSDDSLTPTGERGVHGAIEFGNRMLTYVVTAAAVWVTVAARSAKPRRRSLTRLGWLQFWVVMSNGVIGGITVLTDLNPYIVAAHFLAAISLLTVAVVTWQRTAEGDEAPRPLVGAPVRRGVLALAVLAAALLVVGTAVTGSGKHAGDSSDIDRMPFDWTLITRTHSALAWLVVLGTLALVAVLRLADAPAGPRARARDLLLVLLGQGVIGYVQYFLDEPELLVGIHLFGASLVWIAVLRLLLSTRDRGPVPASAAAEPAPVSAGARPAPTAVTTA